MNVPYEVQEISLNALAAQKRMEETFVYHEKVNRFRRKHEIWLKKLKVLPKRQDSTH